MDSWKNKTIPYESWDAIIVSAGDSDTYHDLIQEIKTEERPLFVYDTIEDQIKDLLSTRNPGLPTSDIAFTKLYNDFLEANPSTSYGNWVYYPWSGRLVHILPEDEFIELRTNRNKYKISEEEQSILLNKTIAVIGLSVGQSVALSIAMERIAGHLILADFDTLDLSNLNRIRSGIHNLGIPKTIVTAREIKEIDPYIKITLFMDGATSDNLEQILHDNSHPIDLLIDECDSMEIKLLLRSKAKQFHIPVLMDTSERGQIDIERYDLDPTLPMFHGALSDLKLDISYPFTPGEKMAIMQRIIDFEKASPRALLSFSEIGKTLKTWPQLATSVIMGGAVTADISRRLLLGNLKSNGRFNIDLNEIIP